MHLFTELDDTLELTKALRWFYRKQAQTQHLISGCLSYSTNCPLEWLRLSLVRLSPTAPSASQAVPRHGVDGCVGWKPSECCGCQRTFGNRPCCPCHGGGELHPTEQTLVEPDRVICPSLLFLLQSRSWRVKPPNLYLPGKSKLFQI